MLPLPQNMTPADTITNNFECGGKTWKCEGLVTTATCTGGKMTCGSGEPKEVDGGGGGGGLLFDRVCLFVCLFVFF